MSAGHPPDERRLINIIAILAAMLIGALVGNANIQLPAPSVHAMPHK